MYENKTILVSGSSGFVGRKLVRKLKTLGANVIEFDYEIGNDVTNWEEIKNLEDIEVIFHLAAITFIPYIIKNPHLAYRVNVMGTINLLELSRKLGCKFIFASSYVYGHPKYLPIDESHPIQPTNLYSKTKIISEEACNYYRDTFGLDLVIIRPFNIYGPNQNNNFLIPSIIQQAKEGKIILNDSRPRRDFIHVDDVITAYLKVGRKKIKNEIIFNIGSGLSHSVEEIVNIVTSFFPNSIEISYLEKSRGNEVLETIADISFSKKVLNWVPTIDIHKGLEDLVTIKDVN